MRAAYQQSRSRHFPAQPTGTVRIQRQRINDSILTQQTFGFEHLHDRARLQDVRGSVGFGALAVRDGAK